VKLDMSLVRRVDANPTKLAVVRSMRQLCTDLGILVVAEGVESPEERDVLVAAGCPLLQGFLFGKPQPGFLGDNR
jgi:EAL domain-containing protein (putative c-di-GMP-specific phosphodiesterase class I)